MNYLLEVVLVLVLVLLALIVLRQEVRSNPEVVTAGGIFLLLSIVGFLMPAALAIWTGTLATPAWVPSLSTGDIILAVLVYAISMALFSWGYQFSGRIGLGVHRAGRTASPLRPAIAQAFRTASLRPKYIYRCLLVSGAIYIASLWIDMQAKGGSWSQYLAAHVLRRWMGEAAPATNWVEWAIQGVGPAMLYVVIVLTLILFFYRKRESRPLLWGFIIPLCCWVLTITTFFRGTQLAFFTSILMVECLRRRLWSVNTPSAGASLGRRDVLIAVMAVVAFIGYGSIRLILSSSAWGEEKTTGTAVTQNVMETLAQSGALQGLATILHEYNGNMLLGGRTYIDMLLLPVPRAIWPSKPSWYGISDITRLEGEPPSTQSAVTMPGEAYANFGWIGLPLMFAFGWLFNLIERLRLRPMTFFVYAFWIPTAVPTTFWMAFTGLMSNLVVLPILIVLVAPAFNGRASSSKRAVQMKRHEVPQSLISSTSIAIRDI